MKWPTLITWEVKDLFKLRESWSQITPQTQEEIESHNESMQELDALLGERPS